MFNYLRLPDFIRNAVFLVKRREIAEIDFNAK